MIAFLGGICYTRDYKNLNFTNRVSVVKIEQDSNSTHHLTWPHPCCQYWLLKCQIRHVYTLYSVV